MRNVRLTIARIGIRRVFPGRLVRNLVLVALLFVRIRCNWWRVRCRSVRKNNLVVNRLFVAGCAPFRLKLVSRLLNRLGKLTGRRCKLVVRRSNWLMKRLVKRVRRLLVGHLSSALTILLLIPTVSICGRTRKRTRRVALIPLVFRRRRS